MESKRVLDVYKLAYDEDYPVVCMEESTKQLIEEIASTPIKPEQEARVDYDWLRNSEYTLLLRILHLVGS